MSLSNIRHTLVAVLAAKENERTAELQQQQLLALFSFLCRPVMEDFRVCGCEHSSVGTAVASPDAELELGSCTAAAAVCHRLTHPTYSPTAPHKHSKHLGVSLSLSLSLSQAGV